jgi:hypothetical protein
LPIRWKESEVVHLLEFAEEYADRCEQDGPAG